MSLTSIIPNKPSELILLALHDFKLAETSKEYTINMGKWHNPAFPEEKIHKCEVCFAGSVMAFSLGANINKYYEPDNFPREERKLRALEEFRNGQVDYGLDIFYTYEDITDYKSIDNYFFVPSYNVDKEGFHITMTKMADYLKKKGY